MESFLSNGKQIKPKELINKQKINNNSNNIK